MNIKRLLCVALLFVGLLMLCRLVFICQYVPVEVLVAFSDDVPKALFNALRFDAQVAAYVIALPSVVYLVVSVWAFFDSRAGFRRHVVKFLRWWFTVAAVLITVVEIIDLGFYRNFGTHINVVFFDFFNEGPWGLMIAMVEDYPVAWFALIIAVIGVLAYLAVRCLVRETSTGRPSSVVRATALMIVYLAFVFLCMRGSADIYPLQIEDTVVSADERVNGMIPNGVYMLKKAWSDKTKAFVMKSERQLLNEYGFKSVEEAQEVYGRGKNVHDALFRIAADTLSAERPDIVLVIAESWSGHLMDVDESLVGNMRRHIDDDIMFRRFQSVCNGTIATIERITVGTPFVRVFSSKWRYKQMPTSIALPFNNSGYRTVMMTGMDQAWENCGEALAAQGFSKVIGKYELMHDHPEYRSNHVGVYDHHLLNSVLEQLQDRTTSAVADTAACRPKFILAITTTNHPPFEMPEDVKLPPLNDKVYKKDCWAKPRNVVEKYLRGYQYENHALAEFMIKLKKSPAADNTIVMITGDHNVRSIFKYETPEQIAYRNSVPLYVYLPPKWRARVGHVDIARRGCHYDILPTMAPFAFSNTEYACFGESMLQTKTPVAESYSYNEMQVQAANVYKTTAERKAAARELFIKLYFGKLFTE